MAAVIRQAVVRLPGRAKLASLQVLRGIAALMVLLFHANLLFGDGSWIAGSRLGGAFAFGHAGVDLFFVLSGFIILHAHWGDVPSRATVVRYVLRRSVRIYPPVVITVLALVAFLPILRIITGDQGFFPVDGVQIVASLLLVPLTCTYVPGVLWSLQAEIYFYLVFLLYFVNRYLFVGTVFLWAALAVGNMALQFLPSLSACGSHPLSLYNTLFAGGVTAYFIWRYLLETGRLNLAPFFLASGGAVFFVSAAADIYFLGDTYWQNAAAQGSAHWKLLTRGGYGLGSMLLIVGAALTQWEPTTRIARIATLLGDASFAIYLVHLPVQGVISRLMQSTTDVGLLTSWSILVLMALASIAAGGAFHLWIEAPLLRALRRISG